MGQEESKENDQPDFSFLGSGSEPDQDAGDFDFGTLSDNEDVSPPTDSSEGSLAAIETPAANTDSTASPSLSNEKMSAPEQNDVSDVTAGSDSSGITGKGTNPVRKVRKVARRTARKEASPKGEAEQSTAAESGAADTQKSPAAETSVGVSQKTFGIVAGYAAALTLLFLLLLATGRLSLSGAHSLESLPDIKPLKSNEFQAVPDRASLPPFHDLNLGESRRFGDVMVTPLRVTREAIAAVDSSRKGARPEQRTTGAVFKLWFRIENVATDIAFAPWDVGLMCHRTPEFGDDASTLANSWLKASEDGGETETRILNYLHPVESQFALMDQHSGRQLQPGESCETFVASSEEVQHLALKTVQQFRWRLQLRKGINRSSGNGVTTLIDVHFVPSEISS